MPNNKTVVKAMDLLQLFLTHKALSLQEMVQLSGIPKTSVHRMVGSLEAMGLLQKEPDGKFQLGLLFLQFGQLVAERLDVRQIALPIMQKLRDEVLASVNLIIADGSEAIYIEKIESLQPVRVYTRIGRRAPLYAGACPRALLSFWPEPEQEDYLQSVELIPFGSGTIRDLEQLRAVLAEAKTNGYTVSHSELEDFSSAVGAPIFDASGQVVAALSIAGASAHFQEHQLPALIAKTKQAARDISQRLGWSEKTALR